MIKKLVICAPNIDEGGPLTVLNEATQTGNFSVVESWLRTLLPEDAGRRCDGAAAIVMTAFAPWPRAECVTQMLRELNEHVAGSYVNEDIADVLEAHAARSEDAAAFATVRVHPSY